MDNRSSRWALLASTFVWGCSASNDPAENAVTSTSPLKDSASESASGANMPRRGDSGTRTPIKHAVIIIGENRTFDHVFATYKPKHHQRINNLLSEGIVNEDGSPGPHFDRARQMTAVDSAAQGYQVSPGSKAPYAKLPPPLSGGPTNPYISDLATAKAVQAGLPVITIRISYPAARACHRKSWTRALRTSTTCPQGRSNSRQVSPTTITQHRLCTASIKCGNSSIAVPAAPRPSIHPVARTTCFLGSRSHLARVAMATHRQRILPMRRRAKVQRPWAFTICCRVMLPI